MPSRRRVKAISAWSSSLTQPPIPDGRQRGLRPIEFDNAPITTRVVTQI